MTRLQSVTGKKIVGALQRLGFDIVRIKGSHRYLRHKDGRATVVPVHSGETIGRGLLAKILRDVEIDAKTLQSNL